MKLEAVQNPYSQRYRQWDSGTVAAGAGGREGTGSVHGCGVSGLPGENILSIDSGGGWHRNMNIYNTTDLHA